MPNENKIKIVKSIEEKFKNSSGLYFTKYTGMNVSQATKLRRDFRENDVDYKITKNTLTKIAAVNAGFDSNKIDSLLQGQIGIAYSNLDPTAPAKVIKAFEKENEDCLEVVGLIFEGEFFEPNKYAELAALPSREELLTKFVVGLNSPMTKLSSTLGSVMTKMVSVLENLKNTK
ncbi:MAG: 50S ribosomal protein L10 [Candidatus Marinimicrobia bacterium]|nr:50S ribosomal protein L10 [Candidatus Neomarinimicrobiota bacterium]|tara:strand:+ start:2016 stop:2537 length:522 start_codon:yes stop_codon:yes gene_type:complete